MTTSDDHARPIGPRTERQATLDELFRVKNARPIQSADDLAVDGLFESDEELDEFLTYTYAARRADLA